MSSPDRIPLPADDPALIEGGLDVEGLARHWASFGARPSMTAEEMRGTPPSTRLGDWTILAADGVTPVPLEEWFEEVPIHQNR